MNYTLEMVAQVMAQATTSPGMSRKQHRPCSQHRLKLELHAKTTNEQKLHNF